MISTILSLIGLAGMRWLVNARLRAHRRRLLNERLNREAGRPRANPTAEDFDVLIHWLYSGKRVECADCRKVLQPGSEPVNYSLCNYCGEQRLMTLREVQG